MFQPTVIYMMLTVRDVTVSELFSHTNQDLSYVFLQTLTPNNPAVIDYITTRRLDLSNNRVRYSTTVDS